MPQKRKTKPKTKKKSLFVKWEDMVNDDGDVFDKIAEQNENALKADGFDECVLGIAYRCGSLPLLAYDRMKCIKKLMKDGMDYEEAEEHMGMNVEGSWLGEGTPIFIEVVP